MLSDLRPRGNVRMSDVRICVRLTNMSDYVSGTTSEYVSDLKAEEILGHHVLQIVFITVEMAQSKIYVIYVPLFATSWCFEFSTLPEKTKKQNPKNGFWAWSFCRTFTKDGHSWGPCYSLQYNSQLKKLEVAKKNETELPRFCLGLQLGETQQKAAVLRPPTILLGLVAIAASGDCNRCPSISLWIDWHRLTVPSKHHALFMVVCLTTEDFSWYPWDDDP